MVENNTRNQLQTSLTEEAKQKLLELETELQKQEQSSRSEISDFIKFKDGDRKLLRFYPVRTSISRHCKCLSFQASSASIS